MDGWPADSTANVGDRVDLTCKAGSGGIPTAFEWYIDGRNAPTMGNALLALLVDERAAGDYKCKAINADGTTESITKTLIVAKAKGELQ